MAEITQLKPFDQVGYAKEIKTLFPYKEKVTRTTDPTNPLYDVVTTTPEFSEDGKKGIYAYAAEKLHNSSTFRKYITKELSGTGLLPKLNEISERVFGKPLESDEDIAAAYTVSQMPTTAVKEKSATDVGAVMDKRRKDAMADWLAKNAITYRQSLAKIAANKQGQQVYDQTTGNAFDEFGGIMPELLPNGGVVEKGIVFDKDGNLYNGEIAIQKEKLPANVSTSLTAAKIPLDKFMNIIVKDGVIQAIRTKNGEVSRQAMENLQKKANTEPIKSPQPVYGKPNGNKPNTPAPPKATTGYSRADLKSGGWTDAQIDAAVKAKKIKLN